VGRALGVARERGVASPAALAAFDANQLPSRADVERIHRYQLLLERSLYRAIGRLAAAQVSQKAKGESRQGSVVGQEPAADAASLALRGTGDAAGGADRGGG
jgi:hypothetical protein